MRHGTMARRHKSAVGCRASPEARVHLDATLDQLLHHHVMTETGVSSTIVVARSTKRQRPQGQFSCASFKIAESSQVLRRVSQSGRRTMRRALCVLSLAGPRSPACTVFTGWL
jgi:hypothetical protein